MLRWFVASKKERLRNAFYVLRLRPCSKAGSKVPAQRFRARVRGDVLRETCCGRRGLPPALHRACGMGKVYDREQAGVLRETGTANGGTAAGVRGWQCVRLRACRRAEKAAKTGDCRACEHAWSKGAKGSKAKARRQALARNIQISCRRAPGGHRMMHGLCTRLCSLRCDSCLHLERLVDRTH